MSHNNGHNRLQALANPEVILREQILAVLADNKTSAEQDIKVLLQCASQIRNRMLVEEIAAACGLELSDFLTDQVLELYYNIERGSDDLGYISKGWEDPGFRIGDTLTVPREGAPSFRKNIGKIRRLCATNGIGITIKEADDSLEFHMDGVIYSEGFNKDTFIKTLDTLNECVEKVIDLLQ